VRSPPVFVTHQLATLCLHRSVYIGRGGLFHIMLLWPNSCGNIQPSLIAVYYVCAQCTRRILI